MRLDLGSGAKPAEGFESVDLYEPSAKWKVNLFKFPWPWADNSVDAINCSHVIEHVPACFTSGQNIPVDENDKDLLCSFFDECWRILKPGGIMHVRVPHVQNVMAFQDMTHRRFITEEMFHYLNREQREVWGIGHYLCKCDFLVETKLIPSEVKDAATNQLRMKHYWNCVHELHVHLVATK